MPRRNPDLDQLPLNAVQPLGRLSRDELRSWAGRSGQRFVDIAFNAGADKKAVLRTIAEALAFPAWFGANLDALYDCLTDLPDRAEAAGQTGWVLVLGKLPGAPHLDADTRAAVIAVFRDAADDLAQRGVPLRVFLA